MQNIVARPKSLKLINIIIQLRSRVHFIAELYIYTYVYESGLCRTFMCVEIITNYETISPIIIHRSAETTYVSFNFMYVANYVLSSLKL